MDEDYIIIRKNTKKEKNIKDAEYFITYDTFERICMASKATKAENVRDYFLILRKFIDYYKTNISNMILKEAKTKPSKCIYVLLLNKNKNILKLGQTKELRQRLKTYASGMDTHPDIKFIMLVHDPKIIENCIKSFLEKFEYKKNREIYKIDIDMIKKIAFKCSGINNELNKLIITQEDKYAYVVFEDKPYNNIKKIKKTQSKQNKNKPTNNIKKTKKTHSKQNKKRSKKV